MPAAVSYGKEVQAGCAEEAGQELGRGRAREHGQNGETFTGDQHLRGT